MGLGAFLEPNDKWSQTGKHTDMLKPLLQNAYRIEMNHIARQKPKAFQTQRFQTSKIIALIHRKQRAITYDLRGLVTIATRQTFMSLFSHRTHSGQKTAGVACRSLATCKQSGLCMSWHGAYLDAGLCGSAQPVAVGGEAQSMDDITSIQTVQPFALCQIPQHGNTILQPPHTT